MRDIAAELSTLWKDRETVLSISTSFCRHNNEQFSPNKGTTEVFYYSLLLTIDFSVMWRSGRRSDGQEHCLTDMAVTLLSHRLLLCDGIGHLEKTCLLFCFVYFRKYLYSP